MFTANEGIRTWCSGGSHSIMYTHVFEPDFSGPKANMCRSGCMNSCLGSPRPQYHVFSSCGKPQVRRSQLNFVVTLISHWHAGGCQGTGMVPSQLGIPSCVMGFMDKLGNIFGTRCCSTIGQKYDQISKVLLTMLLNCDH